MAIAGVRAAWQVQSMDHTSKAVAIATEYLRDGLSPLEAASRMRSTGVSSLPCWEGTGGPDGPLSSIYGAADEADERHFLGKDIERWHPEVREQRRTELAIAEERWRGPVDHACRALIEWVATD